MPQALGGHLGPAEGCGERQQEQFWWKKALHAQESHAQSSTTAASSREEAWGLAGRSICQEQLETSCSSSLEDTQEDLPQNSASLIPALPSLAARATPLTLDFGQPTPLSSTFLREESPFLKQSPLRLAWMLKCLKSAGLT